MEILAGHIISLVIQLNVLSKLVFLEELDKAKFQIKNLFKTVILTI
jgi:hypothetical protein